MEKRIAIGIWKAMSAAEDRARKSIQTKNFNKFVAVANLNNGDAFFDEVLMLFHSSLGMLSNFFKFFLFSNFICLLLIKSINTFP